MASLFQLSFVIILYSQLAFTNQFFHISDVHYDPIANTTQFNSTTLCRQPVYWSGFEDDHWRVDYSPTPGYFGRYGCDAPLALIESTLQMMSWVNSTPEFIVISGDFSPHNNPSFQIELEAISKVTSLLEHYFTYVPIFISLGNNDFTLDYNASCGSAELQSLLKIWEQWIPEDQQDEFLSMGAYSASPIQGLKIIVLNSILYSPKNKNTFSNTTDPCGQFSWLESQLFFAQQQREKVYIVSHIPPGQDTFQTRSLWKPEYISYFHSIVNSYASTIPVMLFGHQHKDEFRLTSFDDEEPIPMLLAPSITPIYSNNPSFRIIDFDSNTFSLLNYHQYYMELLNSNLVEEANWQIEYNFTDAYEMSPIDGNAIKTLLNAIESDEVLFGEWFSRWTVQYQPQLVSLVCNFKYSDPVEFANCVSQNSKWIVKEEL